MKYYFELTGKTPLLMHADNIDAADALEEWRKDPNNKNISKNGDDRSPPWTWQTYLYSDGEYITIPSDNLMVALRIAGAKITMKGQKSFKEVTQSGMFVDTDFLDFKCNGQKVPIQEMQWALSANEDPGTFADQKQMAEKYGFSLFSKRAKIGKNKHVRVRPKFNNWSVSGSLEVFAPEITPEILETIFEISGKGGLCDFRPSSGTPGSYGMYEVSVLEPLEGKKRKAG